MALFILEELAAYLFSATIFFLQVGAWWWVRSVYRRLGDAEGGTLVGIIAFILGWTVILRAIGWISLFGLVFGFHDLESVFTIRLITTFIYLIVVVMVILKVREFIASPGNPDVEHPSSES